MKSKYLSENSVSQGEHPEPELELHARIDDGTNASDQPDLTQDMNASAVIRSRLIASQHLTNPEDTRFTAITDLPKKH